MDPQVTAALVAAVGALLASVVAAISALRTASITRRSAKEIEEIRREQEELRATHQLRHFFATQQVENIKSASSALQKVRDDLRALRRPMLLGRLAEPEYTKAIERALDACRMLEESYQDRHALLPEPVRYLIHEAKHGLATVKSNLHFLQRSQVDPRRIQRIFEENDKTVENLNNLHRQVLNWLDNTVSSAGETNSVRNEPRKR
ncbi:MAG TPA: hypothetical protein VF615_04245 [Longimicrobiaceae bacterium]|jgi:hypothetical protein